VQSSSIESHAGRTSSLVLHASTSPKSAFPRVLPVRISPLAAPRNPAGSQVSPFRKPEEASSEECVPAMAEGGTVSGTGGSSRGASLGASSETIKVPPAAQLEQVATSSTKQGSPPSTPATLPRRPVKAGPHIQTDAKNEDRDPGEAEIYAIRHEAAMSEPSPNRPEDLEAGLGELGSKRDLIARLQALLTRAKALSQEGHQEAAERLLAKVAKYQLLLAESDPSAPLPASLPTRPSHSYRAEVFM
jgi:hypothetical protein